MLVLLPTAPKLFCLLLSSPLHGCLRPCPDPLVEGLTLQVEELAGSGAWDTAGHFPSARPCALALNYLAQRPAPLAGHCVVSPCPAGYTALALLAPLLAVWRSREPGLSRLGREGATARLNWEGAEDCGERNAWRSVPSKLGLQILRGRDVLGQCRLHLALALRVLGGSCARAREHPPSPRPLTWGALTFLLLSWESFFPSASSCFPTLSCCQRLTAFFVCLSVCLSVTVSLPHLGCLFNCFPELRGGLPLPSNSAILTLPV